MPSNGSRGADTIPEEMEFLIFSAADMKMAVDTVQVDSILKPEQAAQQGVSFCRLHEIAGLEKESSSAFSAVILSRNEDQDRVNGLAVDRLEAIITVPIRAIQPMPETLSGFAGPHMFWGLVLHENKVVLLIDLYRLKDRKSCKAVPTA